ncbi:MAG: hypothetical protein E4G94_05270 [ANME-2 cluster archaeon]|nr:MAG: hypothetical protein E4G94_05270 [ANME-2 cluster archaeon]
MARIIKYQWMSFSIPLFTGACFHKPLPPSISSLIPPSSSLCINQRNTRYETAPRPMEITSTSETIRSEPAAAGGCGRLESEGVNGGLVFIIISPRRLQRIMSGWLTEEAV